MSCNMLDILALQVKGFFFLSKPQYTRSISVPIEWIFVLSGIFCSDNEHTLKMHKPYLDEQ